MASSADIIKPLKNRTILAACSEKKMQELSAGLEAMGGQVIRLPLIELREIEDKAPLDRCLGHLHEYQWVLFTSAHAVDFFVKRLRELGLGSNRRLPPICVIGPATAEAARHAGFEVSLMPEKYQAEGILEALEKYGGGRSSLKGQRILLPRALEAREVSPATLLASGAMVDVVPCYRNALPAMDELELQWLRTARPDLVIFTSSSTMRNLIDILGQEDGKRMLQESIVAVLGPITQSTAQSFGKNPEIVPEKSTIASLLEEIGSYYKKHLNS